MFRTLRPLAAPVALAVLLTITNPSAAQKPTGDPVLDRMQKDVFFLASPECEGRGIDTKGIEKAADYIVAAFQKAGVKPAMKDGTFFQPFDVSLPATLGTPTTFVLTGPGDAKKEPKSGTDYAVLGFSPTSKAAGELAFAGFGITAPKLKYDDYAGLNVEGKIVVVLRRCPRYGEKGDKRFDTTTKEGEDSPYASFGAKIEAAAKHKVAALVIVNDASAEAETSRLHAFDEFARGTEAAKFPVLQMSRELFDQILATNKKPSVKELEASIGENLKPQAFELTGWKGSAEVTVDRKKVKAKNIIGVLEGAGPLKDETVVIGAHYDHLGYGLFSSTGGSAARGQIHYGADDNASGTTGLLELARRYGAQKDRQGRRIVFIAFSAEEVGLNGSRHYCQEPLFPLDKTTTMINMDMIGRTKPVSTDWLGLFEKKDFLEVHGTGTGDTFDSLVNAVAKKSDFKVKKLPAGTGPSDHDSFYRKHVPVLFLFTGIHPDYHKPTDEPERIDLKGMGKAVDFAQALADDAVTRATRPKYIVVHDPHAGSVKMSGPRLGFAPGNYGADDVGVLVGDLSPGGAAEASGIKAGDFIVEVAGQPTLSMGAYMKAMSGQKAGTTIDVVVDRNGKKTTLKVKLK